MALWGEAPPAQWTTAMVRRVCRRSELRAARWREAQLQVPTYRPTCLPACLQRAAAQAGRRVGLPACLGRGPANALLLAHC